MADTYETSEKKLSSIRRFIRLLEVDRKDIVYIYIYAIFQGVIYLTLPLGIQAIISQVQANELSSSWGLLIFIVTVGTAIVGVMQIMQLSLTEMLQQKIFSRASFEFAYRLPRIRMESLNKYYPPELVNRFFDTQNIQKGLPKILIDLSTASLQVIFGLILLSFYHPFFVFFGLSLILLLYLIFLWTGPKGLKTSLAESDYKYKVAHWLEEIARTLSTFKLAGETSLALKETNHLVKGYLNARQAHFRVLITQFGAIVGFKTIITLGLLVIGSVLLIEREISLGQFVASEIIIITILNSVEKLILTMESIYDVLTAVTKISKVTDLPLERHEGIDFKEINNSRGMSLYLNRVGFQFEEQNTKALQDISLEIVPGEKVCIAGPPGSGKSLLLRVISGLFQKYEGSIAYNDVSVRDLDPISLRTYIGDCFSQRLLFRGTVMENLQLGRDEVQLSDVRWALDNLFVTDFVNSLPDGLNTLLVPESMLIPESMEKKLIMARCIAKRPQLLVVDERFTIWDKHERDHICQFLTCDQMKTVVAVSNQADFASRCDRIIIMEDGQIIDSGSFEDMKRKPIFDKLFQ